MVIKEDISDHDIKNYISNYIEEVYDNRPVTTIKFNLFSKGKRKHVGYYFRSGSGNKDGVVKDILARFNCDSFKEVDCNVK